MTNGRDKLGRFAVGNSGGPGRRPRETERDYLLSLASVVDMATWARIVARAVADAEAGDSKAREWLSRYLLPTTGNALTQAHAMDALGADGNAVIQAVANELLDALVTANGAWWASADLRAVAMVRARANED